jgi:hypothetical protein
MVRARRVGVGVRSFSKLLVIAVACIAVALAGGCGFNP